MTDPLLQFSSAELSDLGMKRKNNEDAMLNMPEYKVYCVADGMGGADAGEVASSKAVESIRAAFHASKDSLDASVSQKGRIVSKALKEASEWIWNHSVEQGMRSCGTTAVVLVFDAKNSRRALVLHAGDSRAYRFRQGIIAQITRDHSFAEASGVEDARSLPARLQNVITRAVGIARRVVLDETPVDAQAGDIFLLCSDGLTGMLRDSMIQDIIRRNEEEPLSKMAEALIREANNAGGSDNISAILVRVQQRESDAGPRPQPAVLESDNDMLPTSLSSTHATAPAGGIPHERTQVFAPVPIARGGLTLTVRLGLGYIAMLLLILALIMMNDRKRTARANQGIATAEPDIVMPMMQRNNGILCEPSEAILPEETVAENNNIQEPSDKWTDEPGSSPDDEPANE